MEYYLEVRVVVRTDESSLIALLSIKLTSLVVWDVTNVICIGNSTWRY